jgi:NAD(P)-dependent dehydrogenase (short-subunit alcohol dehydrogenase family)
LTREHDTDFENQGETLDAARDQLGENAIAVRSDAASLADIEALADRVKNEFGTVDAMYGNAGVNSIAPFEETSAEVFDQLLAINAKGPYFTVQKLAPLMAEGSGIVLTTTITNALGHPMLSAYAASKATLRSMPQEMVDQVKAQFIADTPMGRLGTPAEVATAMAFLAFDATYTTGTELVVDGGYSQL